MFYSANLFNGLFCICFYSMAILKNPENYDFGVHSAKCLFYWNFTYNICLLCIFRTYFSFLFVLFLFYTLSNIQTNVAELNYNRLSHHFFEAHFAFVHKRIFCYAHIAFQCYESWCISLSKHYFFSMHLNESRILCVVCTLQWLHSHLYNTRMKKNDINCTQKNVFTYSIFQAIHMTLDVWCDLKKIRTFNSPNYAWSGRFCLLIPVLKLNRKFEEIKKDFSLSGKGNIHDSGGFFKSFS